MPLVNMFFLKSGYLLRVKDTFFLKVISVLKIHFFLRFSILSDISVSDYANKKNRFEMGYNLLSFSWNNRLKLVKAGTENHKGLSVQSFYRSANWVEREIWDLYGIFFFKHPDMRRLLSDYGFEGYALRKDFPVSGYLEVCYSDLKENVDYKNLELDQAYRFYRFLNPWSK
jgi:NADH:ubiquinone oxidoreductase subunit C